MSSVWTGSALLTRFSQKYGLTDTTSLARVLEWMNEIQEDICGEYNYPFLTFLMKKEIASGVQEVDLAPQVPSVPTVAQSSGGGTLTDTSSYLVKTTFLLFDSSNREANSLESEPSAASSAIVISGATQKIDLTAIDLYDGTSTVEPLTIHRRIYLSKDGAAYFLVGTITDNTTTTYSITANTTSTIEPPEYEMISALTDDDPFLRATATKLLEQSMDQILAYDPGLQSSGTPNYYCRVSNTKILLYPKPSSAMTLSFYVIRRPSRIFSDSSRSIQLPTEFKGVFDTGVNWKGYEYKDSDGQESKKMNYYELKKEMKNRFGRNRGQFKTVKETY